MTRSDLIAALAYRFRHLTAKGAEVAVKEILGGIGAALARGGNRMREIASLFWHLLSLLPAPVRDTVAALWGLTTGAAPPA